MSRFRLPVKLGIGFFLVLALAGVLGVVALTQVLSLRQAASDLANDQVVSARLLGAMDAASGQYRVAQLQQVIADDAAAQQTEHKTMEEEAGNLETAMDQYHALLDGPAEEAQFQELSTAWTAYKELSGRAEGMPDEAALALLKSDGLTLNDKVQDIIAGMIDSGTRGSPGR